MPLNYIKWHPLLGTLREKSVRSEYKIWPSVDIFGALAVYDTFFQVKTIRVLPDSTVEYLNICSWDNLVDRLEGIFYMGKVEEDAQREERITMEIVVDAYTPEETAMGWYYYLEDKLRFPFPAISSIAVLILKKTTPCR